MNSIVKIYKSHEDFKNRPVEEYLYNGVTQKWLHEEGLKLEDIYLENCTRCFMR